MAYTLAQIKTLARQRANMENSTLVAESELTNYVNASYAELYDLLTSRFEDYYSKTVTFTLADGESEYQVPSDLYKVRGIDYQYSTPSDWVSIREFNFAERNVRNRSLDRVAFGLRFVTYRVMGNKIVFLPEQMSDGTYRLWYIPRYTPLVLDADELSAVLDFEEYIIIDAAIKCLIKEESDISALTYQKEAMKQRVLAMAANRNAGEPERVADTNIFSQQFELLFPRG